MRTDLAPRAAYELWADTYPAVAHNPLMQAEQSVIEPLLTRARATRALDVGTGSGRYLPILRSTGARVVVGIDFSLAMLRRATSNRSAPRERSAPETGASEASLLCADARRLPFRRGAFDLINASLMVGDIGDLNGWVCELARVLARGGQIVYSDFHPSWADRGWRRTFRTAAGTEHEIAIEAHTIDGHLSAIAAAGLTALAIREPRIQNVPDPAIRSFRKQWGNPPVVVAFHAKKP